MKKPIDIRIPLKKGLGIVFSRPIFFAFGACIALPKVLLQFLLVENETIKNFFEALQSGISAPFSRDIFLVPLVAFFALVFGSFGIAAIISLSSQKEKNDSLSFQSIRAGLLRKTSHILQLDLLFIALAVIAGIILTLPRDVALAQGLESLAHTLSLSAIGLILSIALLLFFLRQYAVLYLSLSKISLRAALENAYKLFHTYTKETFLISVTILFIELALIFFLALVEGLIYMIPFPSLITRSLSWISILIAFSFFEAWNWASWTAFFRMIALPKEPESVLQKSETVLQQESAISLDKA